MESHTAAITTRLYSDLGVDLASATPCAGYHGRHAGAVAAPAGSGLLSRPLDRLLRLPR
jgi:hypothetical protein